MKFLLFTALLGLAANAAVIDERAAAMAATEERSIQRRATLATLDKFTGSGCSNYDTTVFVTGDPNFWSGPCFGFASAVPSVKTTSLYGSCTLTVYTDQYCSNGATSARVGQCKSGSWKSFSVDNC